MRRCYKDHPPLPIVVGGDTYSIYGGSCGHPAVIDADVYVGFDFTMATTERQYPWNEGIEFRYPIKDMHAPDNPTTFKALIEWLAVQLIAGKKVHVGCIGGHGRTGTVLAALVTHMTGNVDSITYVRKNYCQKAVESPLQVEFLHKHYGITKVTDSKSYSTTSGGQRSAADKYMDKYPQYMAPLRPINKGMDVELPPEPVIAIPMRNPMRVWSKHVTIDKS